MKVFLAKDVENIEGRQSWIGYPPWLKVGVALNAVNTRKYPGLVHGKACELFSQAR